jgi:hypothetical protein
MGRSYNHNLITHKHFASASLIGKHGDGTETGQQSEKCGRWVTSLRDNEVGAQQLDLGT